MKKLLLMTIMLVLAHIASAQQPYRAWNTFQNDTLSYLTVNFGENKARYIGQKFERVVDDYELVIKFCQTLPVNKNTVTAVRLCYLTSDESIFTFSAGYPYHVVEVTFQEPMHFERDPQFTSQMYKMESDARVVALKMKDAIVANIQVKTYVKEDQ